MERLVEAEQSATQQYNSAIRHPSTSRCQIYSTGTEFALCQAQAQILGAVVGVLTENLFTAFNSFLKVRKAYQTLEGIIQQEKKYIESLNLDSKTLNSRTNSRPMTSRSNSLRSGRSRSLPKHNRIVEDEDEEGDEFFDVAEVSEELEHLQLKTSRTAEDVSDVHAKPPNLRKLSSHIQEGPDVEIFGDNFVDQFVHTSSSMCFGLLQLLLSLIPPVFARLIRIVGFRGDRRLGIELLWRAAKYKNLNGAFAGLALLGYYNAFLQYQDIMPQSGSAAFLTPERCESIRKSFQERFPDVSISLGPKVQLLLTGE